MSTEFLFVDYAFDPDAQTGNRDPVLLNTLLLVLGTISTALTGFVVGSYAIGVDPGTMAILAGAGCVLGFLFARTGLSDLGAHLLSLLMGIVTALVAIQPIVLSEQLRGRRWHEIVAWYRAFFRGTVASFRSGDRLETEVAVFAIGLTVWLIGYTAAWMLFRRGWIFWSLALPGALLLVTLGFDRERAAWPALGYLGLALGIAAAETTMRQADLWNARGLVRPASYGRRTIAIGLLMIALAVGIGVAGSFDLDDRFIERATGAGDRLARWVETQMPANKPAQVPQRAAGNYAAFADQFKVGEGVANGDSPIAVVQASGEKYLAARRLDEYDGTGWLTSTVQVPESAGSAPRIAFQSDQAMNIPRSQLEFRTQDRANVTLLQPTGDLLYTIDQHYSASEPTLVRVGWDAVDVTYTIGQVSFAAVPVDLREMIILLESSTFVPGATGAVPELENPQARVEFQRIQERLQTAYPLDTELSWAEDGSVQLHAKGRLPVYSDVEAVYGADQLSDGSYSVTGLIPRISVADLQQAGTDYPAYITTTYLQLPDTVTQETRDLATRIVTNAGTWSPYDQALAIQNYLRANFTYQLDAGPAPDGRDIVDYFLFDSQVGRCDHYASSMVVMLRMLGVPARIVTGFSPVAFDPEMSGFVYRGRNAHAWVEVYFPGFGWLPFEPTPSQSEIDLENQGGAPSVISTPTSRPEPTSTTVDEEEAVNPEPTFTATPLPMPGATEIDDASSNSAGALDAWPYLVAALLALGGVIGGLFFWRRRNGYAGMSIARANYSRLQRLGQFIGVEPSPALTPHEYAARFGFAKPQAAEGAGLVASAYTRDRYATNADAVIIAQESEYGWKEAKRGASDWRIWRRR